MDQQAREQALSAPWPPSALLPALFVLGELTLLAGAAVVHQASLVASINSILGGAGLALLAARVADLGMGRRCGWTPLSPSYSLCPTCCISSAHVGLRR
jgi:hypothetical protein